MAILYFLVIRCPQPKKEENLVYIDYDLLKMNHLTLLIWMMNASSLLFVCDCWAATSTTMSSAEMATEDTRAEVIKDSSSTTSSSPAAAASVERKCFVCYSCKRVETSQSVPCSEDEDQCMVRLVYVLGRVLYDRVWKRKKYFETAFLNFERGTSRVGNSNENKNANKHF